MGQVFQKVFQYPQRVLQRWTARSRLHLSDLFDLPNQPSDDHCQGQMRMKKAKHETTRTACLRKVAVKKKKMCYEIHCISQQYIAATNFYINDTQSQFRKIITLWKKEKKKKKKKKK